MSDQLANSSRSRILNIVDDFSHQCVGQVIDISISGFRLARFLDGLGQSALPKVLVCDNGSELTSKAIFFWSQRSWPKLRFIQPGKPTQNAFVESLNGMFRANCLNEHWFKGLADARQAINAWRHRYNCVRPHNSLSYVPPEKYAKQATCYDEFPSKWMDRKEGEADHLSRLMRELAAWLAHYEYASDLCALTGPDQISY